MRRAVSFRETADDVLVQADATVKHSAALIQTAGRLNRTRERFFVAAIRQNVQKRVIFDAFFKLRFVSASETVFSLRSAFVVFSAAAHQMLDHSPLVVERIRALEFFAAVAAAVDFFDVVGVANLPVRLETFGSVAVAREEDFVAFLWDKKILF